MDEMKLKVISVLVCVCFPVIHRPAHAPYIDIAEFQYYGRHDPVERHRVPDHEHNERHAHQF